MVKRRQSESAFYLDTSTNGQMISMNHMSSFIPKYILQNLKNPMVAKWTIDGGTLACLLDSWVAFGDHMTVLCYVIRINRIDIKLGIYASEHPRLQTEFVWVLAWIWGRLWSSNSPETLILILMVEIQRKIWRWIHCIIYFKFEKQFVWLHTTILISWAEWQMVNFQ